MAAAAIYGQSRDPVPTRIVNIEYPDIARSSRTAGTVEIRCMIRADGHVERAERVTGPEMLAAAVFAKIGEWRFTENPTATVALTPVVLTFCFVFERGKPKRQSVFTFDFPSKATIMSQPYPVTR